MKDHTGRDEVIFEQARQLPAVDRPAYLESACGADLELRRRVESRLRTYDEQSPGPKMTTPVAEDDEWPSAIPRPAVVGQKVGQYKLIEELGEGGGGMVFLAEQESPVRRRVALKIIKLGMDTEDVIARFEAERQALAMMDHPNIARVFDAGATPTGRPYFVMELVRGVPITQFCDEHKLSLTDRLKLFVQVCNAVQHAHQKGIIHRDIKPSNILVAMHDGAPVPKIIDFGISKATGGRLTDKTYYTTHDQFVGTPAYMSPEQAEMTNLDVDTRSDIYSLGVLLYQLLTSVTPLDAHELHDAGIDEIRRRIREDEPRRPSVRLAELDQAELVETAKARGTDPQHLISQVRGDLDWIAMRSLEKDRQRRYESASALAQDIQRHLDHQPVLASPPSTWYSLQKMVRRHRVIFAAASAVVAALVIGFGTATRSYYHELQAHQTAEAEKTRADEQANAARLAKAETEQQKREVQEALARTDYIVALSLLQEDHAPEAVAHLVRALRANPNNRPAAALLCSILTMKNWLVPLSETSTQGLPARGNQAPNGRRGQPGAAGRGQNAPGGLGRGQNGGGQPPPRGQFNPVWGRSVDGTRILQQASFGAPVAVHDNNTDVTFPAINSDSAILSANLSADGRRVLTISADRTARVWDAETGQPISEPMLHDGNAGSGQFSADGRRVVMRSFEPNADGRGSRTVETVWEFADDAALLLQVRASSPISQIAQSGDGLRLLTLSDNATMLSVLDAVTGDPIDGPVKYQQELRSATFSPDGQHILSVSRLGVPSSGYLFQVQDIAATPRVSSTSIEERAVSPQIRGPVPMTVVFSPDGKQLVVGIGRMVYLIDAADGNTRSEPWPLTGAVNDVEFNPGGGRVLVASTTAQIWDLEHGAQVLEFAKDSGPVFSAAYSPDGKQALTVSRSGLAQVWDAQTGEAVSEVVRHGDQNILASFSPDGTRLLTFTRTLETPLNPRALAVSRLDSTARVWDAATGQPVSALMQCGSNLKSAKFTADGRWVLTSADSARVWDAATGLAVSVPMPGRETLISPDGRRLLILGDDGIVRVWPFTDRIGPPWILDVAEMLARCRIDSTGSVVFYPGKTLDELRKLAEQSPDANEPMVRWARRLLGVTPPAATGKN